MQKKGPLIYRNKKYGFALTFPRWWKKHAFIDDINEWEGAEASISFLLRYSRRIAGKSWTDIIRILVFRMTRQQWLEHYEDSPLVFLGEKHERVFAYITPSEPPEEFLDEDKSDYNRELKEFQWLYQMQNEDIPRVIETFCFYKK